MEKKMKFIIWTWGWSKHIGGVRVLHNLCHYLNEIGQEAYITTKIKNPKFNTPYHNPDSSFDKDNTVVIYPECIDKNLLDAKHVVRWMLYNQDITANYGENDYIFKYFESFLTKDDKCDGILTIHDFDLDFWKNENQDRSYNMVAVRKGHYKYHPGYHSGLRNVIFYDDIEKEQDETIIKNLMNKSEIFLCFDACSFVAAQAALCGCKTIVIPDRGVSKEQWRENHTYTKYGIAYGHEDMQYASETKDMLRPYLKELEEKKLQTVHDFVKFWKEKLT